MKRNLIHMILFMVSGAAFAQGRVPVLTAGNAEEFAMAIGSDRIIALKAGTYDLGTVQPFHGVNLEWTGTGDGREFTVRKVNNLTIRGEKDVYLTARSPTAAVLVIEDSRDIRLESVSISHSGTDACRGAAIRVATSQDVEITSCDLSGPGSLGIGIKGSGGIRCSDSIIGGAASGAIRAERCFDLAFRNLTVRANGGCAVYYDDVKYSLFLECVFDLNYGPAVIAITGVRSGSVTFENCSFEGNRTQRLYDGSLAPGLFGCTFRDNSFDGGSGMPGRREGP